MVIPGIELRDHSVVRPTRYELSYAANPCDALCRQMSDSVVGTLLGIEIIANLLRRSTAHLASSEAS